MKQRKPCVICSDPKAPGHPLYCADHILIKQPIEVQVADATAARTAFLARAEAAGYEVKRPAKETWPTRRTWCHGCFRFRRFEFFGKNATQCRACVSQKAHAAGLVKKFGMTAGDYEIMFERQGGRCAICRNRQTRQRLAVHHDHVTGDVRALCCDRCNHDLLGAAHDSAWILLRAYALQAGGWPAVEKVLASEVGRTELWNPWESE